MSHTVRIKACVTNPHILSRACTRLKLNAPIFSPVENPTSAQVSVRPNSTWPYAFFSLQNGEVSIDNMYQEDLDPVLQSYQVEAAKYAAEQQGFSYTERETEEGAIELLVTTGY